MELSDCTEVIQERFQRAYAGMREKQQDTVRRNPQYYKPIVSQFRLFLVVLIGWPSKVL